MRLIFILFALMQTRLGEHELERARMLDRYAEEAMNRGIERMNRAHAYAARANVSDA